MSGPSTEAPDALNTPNSAQAAPASALEQRLALRAAGPGRWRNLHGDVNQNGRAYGQFEATGVHGPASLASRVTIRAGLAALAGDIAEASALYRQALAAWREMGLPWDIALTVIDMAALLGPGHPDVRSVAPEARTILEGLGAVPYLARLESALVRTPGMTPRELASDAASAITPA